jgi:hypothetical protein
MFEAALDYHRLGFSIIPMGAKVISESEVEKFPLIAEWKCYQVARPIPEKIKEWWAKWPEAMIGVICGRISGIIAIDTDTQEADEQFQSLLPESLVVPICTTPRGGKHYIFRYQEGIKNSNGSLPFEIKSDGATIILPPSRIPDGRVYRWN